MGEDCARIGTTSCTRLFATPLKCVGVTVNCFGLLPNTNDVTRGLAAAHWPGVSGSISMLLNRWALQYLCADVRADPLCMKNSCTVTFACGGARSPALHLPLG